MRTNGFKPILTVGIPVYNGAQYLTDSIDSILSQTFTNFELTISDNGSSDETEEICRDFARRDPRLRYIRQSQNMGSVWNFNHVFSVSNSVYFKWAAHDDLIKPTFLERCIEILESDPGCVLAHSATALIDENGLHLKEYDDLMACDSDAAAQRFRQWMIGRPMGLCNPLFGVMRRDILKKTSLLGSYVASDRVLLGEVAMAGRVRMVKESLFLRRWTIESLSTKANPDTLSLERFHTGQAGTGLRFKTFRLIGEFTRSIHKMELPVKERVLCYFVLLEWSLRLWKLLLKEAALPFYRNGRPTKLGRVISLR